MSANESSALPPRAPSVTPPPVVAGPSRQPHQGVTPPSPMSASATPEPPAAAAIRPTTARSAVAADEAGQPGPQQPANASAEAAAAPAVGEKSGDAPSGTLFQKLKAADKYWAVKAGLRVAICIFALVVIGCSASIVARSQGIRELLGMYRYYYYSDFMDTITQLVVLPIIAVCLAWSLIALLVRFLRRTHRPVHPGVIVGIDLVLWLALIFPTAMTVFSVHSIQRFGNGGEYLPDPSYGGRDYSGRYYLDKATNTWIYNITHVYSSEGDNMRYNLTSGEWYYAPIDPSTIRRDCTPSFESCEQQDATVNELWREKPARVALNIANTVFQLLITICHFILFVWACVDTHQRRQVKGSQIATQVALQAMINRGELIINPNATQHHPWAYYPIPQPPPSQPAANGEKAAMHPGHQSMIYGGVAPGHGSMMMPGPVHPGHQSVMMPGPVYGGVAPAAPSGTAVARYA